MKSLILAILIGLGAPAPAPAVPQYDYHYVTVLGECEDNCPENGFYVYADDQQGERYFLEMKAGDDDFVGEHYIVVTKHGDKRAVKDIVSAVELDK